MTSFYRIGTARDCELRDSELRNDGVPQREWRAGAIVSALTLTLAATLLVAPRSSLQAQTPANAPTSGAMPLTLAEALRLATGASETIGLAQAGAQRANGAQYQARSALMPQLSTSLNWSKTLQNQFQAISRKSSSGNNSGGTGGDTTTAENPLTKIFASPYTTTFAITGSLPLFTGGKATANIRAANLGRESAEIGIASARAAVQLDVTQAYYDAVLADRLVQIAESSLVQSERTLRQVQLTRSVGSASEFELIRARVTRDNQRPGWLQSRTNRDLAYVRLHQLLNLPLDRPLALTDGIVEAAAPTATTAPAAPITTVNVAPADVLTIDPSVRAEVTRVLATTDTGATVRAPVRQAMKSVAQAEQQLRATKAQRLPTITATTNYQRLAYPNNGVPASFGDFFPNWTAGFGVSFPFFTGGRVHGDLLAAEASVKEAKLRLQQAQEGASLDARQSVAQLEQAEAAWQASVGTAEQATRSYDIAEVRFREGISTQIELSETRVQLQQALANRAKAARDLQVARVRLQLLRDLPLSSGGAQSASPSGAQSTGSSTPTGNTP